MNERIKELAEQAWDSTRDEIGSFVDDGGEVNWDFLHTYDKKFAELIVRECADVLVAEMNRLDGLDRVVSAQTMDTAQILIKQHFGVEE